MMTKEQLNSGSLVITIYELKYSISGQMRPSVTRSHEMLQEYYVDSKMSIVGIRLKYVYCHLTLSHSEKKVWKQILKSLWALYKLNIEKRS